MDGGWGSFFFKNVNVRKEGGEGPSSVTLLMKCINFHILKVVFVMNLTDLNYSEKFD